MRISMLSIPFVHQHLREIFMAAVNSVQTSTLIRNNVKCSVDATLTIVNHTIKLKKPCYVIGFGKAVYDMSVELFSILGANLQRGLLCIPHGTLKKSQGDMSFIEHYRFSQIFDCYEGAKNNLPDEDAQRGAHWIKILAEGLKEDDVVIVLISGGGSALLPLPKKGVTIKDKQKLSKKLFDSGANINEVNSVRKQLSELKGGGLAKFAYPAKVFGLILSDVIGDPLEIIASGPTYPNIIDSNPLEIVKKYKLLETISPGVLECLSVKKQEDTADLKKLFANVKNFVIGNNSIACEEAKRTAELLNYETIVMSTKIEGKLEDIANFYFKLVNYVTSQQVINFIDIQACVKNLRFEETMLNSIQHMKASLNSVCMIFGAEPTVVVRNQKGKGGRNMHLALQVSTLIASFDNVSFLSCGTDGIDGPTDAAGAISPYMLNKDEIQYAQKALNESDSYTFLQNYENGEYLIKTGHTGTNVMDVHILIINKHS